VNDRNLDSSHGTESTMMGWLVKGA
jgi:hypothetical protein